MKIRHIFLNTLWINVILYFFVTPMNNNIMMVGSTTFTHDFNGKLYRFTKVGDTTYANSFDGKTYATIKVGNTTYTVCPGGKIYTSIKLGDTIYRYSPDGQLCTSVKIGNDNVFANDFVDETCINIATMLEQNNR